MSLTYTASSTFTMTDARQVSSKLGADLVNLNARYGQPALETIEDYVEEAALFLKFGYLEYVDYGFKIGDQWIVRLRYTPTSGSQLRDAPPGGLPAAQLVAGAQFYTILCTNSAYSNATPAERESFDRSLPVGRTPGTEPRTGIGQYGDSRQYSRNGAGLNRDVFVIAN